MRTMKFRAFVFATDSGAKPMLMQYERPSVIFGWEDCASLDIMQFTGMLDKNGKEIYEGDIVRFHWQYDSKRQTADVIFANDAFSILLRNEIEKERNRGGNYVRLCQLNRVEVIGNIHENPELLKA